MVQVRTGARIITMAQITAGAQVRIGALVRTGAQIITIVQITAGAQVTTGA